MSAIFGIRARDGRSIERQELSRFARATERYAPDGTSLHIGAEIGMGFQAYHTHRRSQLESQPLVDEHGNLLAFDGRLDNYQDLCGVLGIRAYESSDSLIILKAFDRWGDDCFSQFVGDWSLSLWTPATQSLYLARDHAGTRTLYFEDMGEYLLWSTHLETFFVTKKTRELNEEFAALYLSCQPIGERTPYKGIAAVPSAHFLKLQSDCMVPVPHWQPLFQDQIQYQTDAEYERHFFSLFRQAVARRADPSDPVIAQLSGGMDSTAIVSMSDFIRKEAGAVPQELIDTVSYYDNSESNWNEKPYFTAVERRRGKAGIHIATSYIERNVEPPDPAYLLPGTDGSGLAAERKLEESIGRGRYRAVLSGIGGDELLGGPINPIPELANYLVRGKIKRFLSGGISWCLSEKASMIHILPGVIRAAARLYWPAHRSAVDLAPWLDPRVEGILPGLELPGTVSLRFLPSSVDAWRTWPTILDTQPHRFPGATVRYEYRYPLLDLDLVNFLLRVPPEQIRRPGNRRSLMRRALQRTIAPEVLEKRRKAFPARGPFLFIAEHSEEIDTLFYGSTLNAMGYLDEKRLRGLLHQETDAMSAWTRPLMKTIELELWLRCAAISVRERPRSHTRSAPGKPSAMAPWSGNLATLRGEV